VRSRKNSTRGHSKAPPGAFRSQSVSCEELLRLHSTRQSSLAYHADQRLSDVLTDPCRASASEILSILPAAALVLQLSCTLNYHGENEGTEGCPDLVTALHWTPLLDAMACAYPSPMTRLIDCKRYVHDLRNEPRSRSAHCPP